MSMKTGYWRWVLASAAVVTIVSGAANAQLIHDPPSVTTNTSAGIIILPKIRVDDSLGIDTLIQVTNVSDVLTRAHCFYVNANAHCSNLPTRICTQETFLEPEPVGCPAGGLCIDGWQETDFRLTLTKRQPVSWPASTGRGPGAPPPFDTFPLPGSPGDPDDAQTNQDSLVPGVPEVPFIGEMRCIEVDIATQEPIDLNDLKGEATIVTVTDDVTIDAAKYNAIGIPALDNAVGDGNPGVLNIGGPLETAEYNACPNILTLNHFFDGAEVVTHGGGVVGEVNSRLTVVPCSADFLNQDRNLASATIQFLVYNEFEQRFSTSTRVTCYRDVQLSDIDTRPGDPGNAFSIFSVGVQGTLTGQSRLRSVSGTGDYEGNGILAVLQENWDSGSCSNPGIAGEILCEDTSQCNFGTCTNGTCTGNPDVTCSTSPDCVGTCRGASLSTTLSNVQYSGARARGDQIIIPLP